MVKNDEFLETFRELGCSCNLSEELTKLKVFHELYVALLFLLLSYMLLLECSIYGQKFYVITVISTVMSRFRLSLFWI